MNKKTFLILAIIGGIIFVALLCLTFLFFAAFGGFTSLVSVEKPTVTHGEFPFRLEYELDGNINVIEDTIICEFDGFEVWGEAGKYRKWKTYLKSDNEQNSNRRITLLDVRSLKEQDYSGHEILELFFSYGNGEYYMGDNQHRSKAEIRNYVEYLYQNEDGTTGGSAFDADEAWERYRIRLINWQPSPPIENSFK